MKHLLPLLCVTPLLMAFVQEKNVPADDILVEARRPVLKSGAWRISQTAWRMSGGVQTRNGNRTLFYCVGKEDIGRLLLVMIAGRQGEYPSQCEKMTMNISKGIIGAKWRCRDLGTMSATLRAPYSPDVIDAVIDMNYRGNGRNDHGGTYFRRTSRAEYVAECPG